MNIHKLNNIFDPQRIALVGVTTNPNSVSGKVLINLVSGGFRGVVYPVNPENEAVMGIPCYPDILSLPKVPDLAIICTPAEKVPQAVRECGEKGIRGIIVMSAGFRETGEEGRKLEEEVTEAIRSFEGMRVIGPNCLGIIVPALKLNASFASGMPKPGNIAFISQSGALCTSVLDWAMEGKIGFSQFVSIGNSIDVEFGDLIDYFGEDENTRCIILYIESIRHPRNFMTAARAFARKKPIIVYKAGRFPESAQVAASHTGAMASEDAVYDAAFARAGLARVYEIGDIFSVAEMIGRNKFPQGPGWGSSPMPGDRASWRPMRSSPPMACWPNCRRRPWRRSTKTCRLSGRTEIRSTCWATPGPNGSPKRRRSYWMIPASMPCSSSSLPRR